MTFIGGAGTSVSFGAGVFKAGGGLSYSNATYAEGKLTRVRLYNNFELTPEQIKVIYDIENLDNHK